MNVLRSHLVPNTLLQEAFDKDFKSLKPETQPVVNRLLKMLQYNDPQRRLNLHMLLLSKFLGALHLELNSEDLSAAS